MHSGCKLLGEETERATANTDEQGLAESNREVKKLGVFLRPVLWMPEIFVADRWRGLKVS